MAASTLSDVVLRAESENIPLSALCEITHACNVDCEHCYLDLVPDKKIGALSTDEWKRIFRELRAAGTLFLTLSGGEILVRRDWFELATYARELGFAVRLFTNGVLIDEENADRIASLPPIAVEISLLGGLAATHDAIARRRGVFDKTIAGVKRLRARGVHVLLKCVLMKRNVDERKMILAIAQELGTHVQFDVEVTPKNNGSLDPQELAAEEEKLVEALQELRELDWANGRADEPESPHDERLQEAPCAAGRRNVHIAPTGDISPCTQWGGHPIANLREKSFAEVWSGDPTLAEIRTKRLIDFPICASCELLPSCGPCMALSFLERGVIDGPSPTKCVSAELRAKARGIPGRSAWLLKQESARASGVTRASDVTHSTRVRLPLVG